MTLCLIVVHYLWLYKNTNNTFIIAITVHKGGGILRNNIAKSTAIHSWFPYLINNWNLKIAIFLLALTTITSVALLWKIMSWMGTVTILTSFTVKFQRWDDEIMDLYLSSEQFNPNCKNNTSYAHTIIIKKILHNKATIFLIFWREQLNLFLRVRESLRYHQWHFV